MIFRLKLAGNDHGNSCSKSTEVSELVWDCMQLHYMVVFLLSSMTGKEKLSGIFHI